MNATSNTSLDPVQDTNTDSDTDEEHAPPYYQPISSVDPDPDDRSNSDEEHHHEAPRLDGLANGHLQITSSLEVRNRMSSLELSDEEEEDGEESDSAISRAFREDEERRNAPLGPENARRVVEAMRGVSFSGVTPDWEGRVPEEQWVDLIRRIRQPPGSSSVVRN